jgi:hypothetical protein
MSSVSEGGSPSRLDERAHDLPESLVGKTDAARSTTNVLLQHLFHLFRVDLLATAVDARRCAPAGRWHRLTHPDVVAGDRVPLAVDVGNTLRSSGSPW